MSSLAGCEAAGAVYRDRGGRPGDALVLLRDAGVNAVRLRVWVDPPGGVNSSAAILPVARRARALGLDVLVDLHCSDDWADPGRQDTPAAWRNLAGDALEAAFAAHPRAVCESLLASGVTPAIVQLGNEIDDGLLWPAGRARDHLDRTAALLRAGAAAVRAASPRSLVLLHLAGGDAAATCWLLDGLRARGVHWDLTGVSYYPAWHGGSDALAARLRLLAARYARPVVVVETAAPYTLANRDAQPNRIGEARDLPPGTAATPAAQAAHVERVTRALARVPHGRGWGFFWWEGAWIVPGPGWNPRDPTSGNPWDNQALFDSTGRALPALDRFAR